ncbi:MAG: TetR/AcrR family transcriptional regulator, ethionamide resistance regulator [Solirubrobacteraceae bacterium]|jgi:AcrR family transcriptional regulator|nr:TetR/AcrR family transcriptional regulator, ethionamide resistance regulator [Solirubrobacteraceae bacterium]
MATTSEPSRRTRAEQRELLRSGIFSAFERLLQRIPYAEMTVDQIIGESDIGRSTFYAHFNDKADLLVAAFNAINLESRDVFRGWVELPAPPPRSALENVIGELFDLFLGHRDVLAALVQAAGSDTAVDQHYVSLHDTFIEPLRDHIIAGQANGAVHTTLDPDRTAAWLVWMLERGLHQLVGAAGTAEAARHLQAVTDIVWFALYA